jgi:hypothetical protein
MGQTDQMGVTEPMEEQAKPDSPVLKDLLDPEDLKAFQVFRALLERQENQDPQDLVELTGRPVVKVRKDPSVHQDQQESQESLDQPVPKVQ